MVKTRVFLDITTPSSIHNINKQQVTLNSLELYAYSLKGVPVTGESPDNMFLNLNFPDLALPSWQRTDGKAMPALACTDVFTHDHLPVCQHI